MISKRLRVEADASPEKWESGTPQTELLAGLAACVDHYDWLGEEVSDADSRRGRIEAAYRAAIDHVARLVTRLNATRTPSRISAYFSRLAAAMPCEAAVAVICRTASS